jgi:hypothetical protein
MGPYTAGTHQGMARTWYINSSSRGSVGAASAMTPGHPGVSAQPGSMLRSRPHGQHDLLQGPVPPVALPLVVGAATWRLVQRLPMALVLLSLEGAGIRHSGPTPPELQQQRQQPHMEC